MTSDFEKSLISSVKEMVKYYSEQKSGSVTPGVEIVRDIDVVDLVSDIKVDSREHFVAISLDSQNRVLRKSDISVGIINQSLGNRKRQGDSWVWKREGWDRQVC